MPTNNNSTSSSDDEHVIADDDEHCFVVLFENRTRIPFNLYDISRSNSTKWTMLPANVINPNTQIEFALTHKSHLNRPNASIKYAVLLSGCEYICNIKLNAPLFNKNTKAQAYLNDHKRFPMKPDHRPTANELFNIHTYNNNNNNTDPSKKKSTHSSLIETPKRKKPFLYDPVTKKKYTAHIVISEASEKTAQYINACLRELSAYQLLCTTTSHNSSNKAAEPVSSSGQLFYLPPPEICHFTHPFGSPSRDGLFLRPLHLIPTQDDTSWKRHLLLAHRSITIRLVNNTRWPLKLLNSLNNKPTKFIKQAVMRVDDDDDDGILEDASSKSTMKAGGRRRNATSRYSAKLQRLIAAAGTPSPANNNNKSDSSCLLEGFDVPLEEGEWVIPPPIELNALDSCEFALASSGAFSSCKGSVEFLLPGSDESGWGGGETECDPGGKICISFCNLGSKKGALFSRKKNKNEYALIPRIIQPHRNIKKNIKNKERRRSSASRKKKKHMLRNWGRAIGGFFTNLRLLRSKNEPNNNHINNSLKRKTMAGASHSLVVTTQKNALEIAVKKNSLYNMLIIVRIKEKKHAPPFKITSASLVPEVLASAATRFMKQRVPNTAFSEKTTKNTYNDMKSMASLRGDVLTRYGSLGALDTAIIPNCRTHGINIFGTSLTTCYSTEHAVLERDRISSLLHQKNAYSNSSCTLKPGTRVENIHLQEENIAQWNLEEIIIMHQNIPFIPPSPRSYTGTNHPFLAVCKHLVMLRNSKRDKDVQRASLYLKRADFDSEGVAAPQGAQPEYIYKMGVVDITEYVESLTIKIVKKNANEENEEENHLLFGDTPRRILSRLKQKMDNPVLRGLPQRCCLVLVWQQGSELFCRLFSADEPVFVSTFYHNNGNNNNNRGIFKKKKNTLLYQEEEEDTCSYNNKTKPRRRRLQQQYHHLASSSSSCDLTSIKIPQYYMKNIAKKHLLSSSNHPDNNNEKTPQSLLVTSTSSALMMMMEVCISMMRQLTETLSPIITRALAVHFDQQQQASSSFSRNNNTELLSRDTREKMQKALESLSPAQHWWFLPDFVSGSNAIGKLGDNLDLLTAISAPNKSVANIIKNSNKKTALQIMQQNSKRTLENNNNNQHPKERTTRTTVARNDEIRGDCVNGYTAEQAHFVVGSCANAALASLNRAQNGICGVSGVPLRPRMDLEGCLMALLTHLELFPQLAETDTQKYANILLFGGTSKVDYSSSYRLGRPLYEDVRVLQGWAVRWGGCDFVAFQSMSAVDEIGLSVVRLLLGFGEVEGAKAVAGMRCRLLSSVGGG